MLPHIIQSQIDEAEAQAAKLHEAANQCNSEQQTRMVAAALALENMCSLARQLGFAAITNHDTIVNRKAS
jgi:hypothetical protein